MHGLIGRDAIVYFDDDWVLVKSYDEFVSTIQKEGAPEMISFDHDLAIGHYHKNMQQGILNYNTEDFNDDSNKTGYHCARWLCDYLSERDLDMVPYLVHSMNPIGAENITSLLESYKKSRKN